MKLATALLAWLPAVCCADMYKCQTANGSVYQEKPCAVGGVKIEIESPPVDTGRSRFDQAINLGKIQIGMTTQDVLRAWGRPNKINRTAVAGGISEQWVYERPNDGRHQYVYFDNGLLSAVQTPGQVK